MPGIKVGHNIESLTAQRHLGAASARLADTFQKLSSGMRINKASDDAAGLAISESLKKDVRVYGQAIRNLNDGVSALNIAQGALTELINITTRQQELAEQAANGVYSFQQRKALNKEAASLSDEFNRIVESAEFNGLKLIDVTQTGEIRLQAGYGVDGSLSFAIGSKLSRAVGTGSFEMNASYHSQGDESTNAASKSVSLGDVNGDGLSDMVVAGYVKEGINWVGRTSVFINDGSGAFTLAGSYRSQGDGSTHARSNSISLGDVNGDGLSDMVVAGYVTEGGMRVGRTSVYINDGSGSFTLAGTYRSQGDGSTHARSNSISLGDVNGDGLSDMVVAGYVYEDGHQVGRTSVFINDGSGAFTLASTYRSQGDGSTHARSNSISLADLNDDGLSDIVVAGYVWEGGRLVGRTSVFINDGLGAFTLAGSYRSQGDGSTNAYSSSVSLGDINGDGLSDMVVAGYVWEGSKAVGRTSVYINNGSGAFTLAGTYRSQGDASTHAWSNSVSLGDINGDGLSDMVVAGRVMEGAKFVGRTSVFINDGLGSFTLAGTYRSQGDGSIDATSTSISLGDINSDGVVDIAVAGAINLAFNNHRSYTSVLFADNLSRRTTVVRQDLTTQAKAREALTEFQKQLSRISSELGSIGSFLSRLDVATNALYSTRDNSSAAASRIMDADIAEASSTLVRTQILQQAGSAVLAQANQQPALALRLLGG